MFSTTTARLTIYPPRVHSVHASRVMSSPFSFVAIPNCEQKQCKKQLFIQIIEVQYLLYHVHRLIAKNAREKKRG